MGSMQQEKELVSRLSRAAPDLAHGGREPAATACGARLEAATQLERALRPARCDRRSMLCGLCPGTHGMAYGAAQLKETVSAQPQDRAGVSRDAAPLALRLYALFSTYVPLTQYSTQ